MPFVTPYVECRINTNRAALLKPLVYLGAVDRFEVPTLFVTDFASVPQFVVWLVPRLGAWTKAAVLHDHLCVQLEQGDERVTAVDVDGIFRRVMREEGVGVIRRWLIWGAVRLGALATPARRPGWLRTAPAVLGIAALALPVVAPAAILAGLTLLVDQAVETAAGWWWR